MKRLLLVLAFALLVAACGGSDQIAEEAVEQAIGGNAEVEITEDGDDVTINIESDEGSISIGTGAELPDELEIPVPDGGDVLSSVVAGGQVAVTVVYSNDRYDDIVAFYDSWAAGTGDEWDSGESTFSAGDATVRSAFWNSADNAKSITVTDCPGMDVAGGAADAVCVSVLQA